MRKSKDVRSKETNVIISNHEYMSNRDLYMTHLCLMCPGCLSSSCCRVVLIRTNGRNVADKVEIASRRWRDGHRYITRLLRLSKELRGVPHNW